MSLVDLVFGTSTQSTVGALTLDVLLSEKITYPSNITEYPVESGSPINDSIIPQSVKLSISGTVEGGSVSLFSSLLSVGSSGKVKLQDAKTTIEALWTNHTPITVVTGLGVYQNMGLGNCEVSRAGSGAGSFISINAELVQINTVSNSTTTVAENPAATVAKKTGATKAAAGQVTGGDPSDQAATTSTSIAKSLSNTISGFFK